MNLTTQPLLFRHGRRWLIPGLALLLAACTVPSQPAATIPAPMATTPNEVAAPVTATTPLTPSMTITATETLTTPVEAAPGDAAPQLSTDEQAIVAAAIALVAAEIGADQATITLVDLQAVEWPDSSLGCPQPDMMYMQVITPGYQLTLQDEAGVTYAVHSERDPAGQVVLCQDAAATGTAALSGIFTGTVTYLQRIALPAGSVVQVELQDVSRADAPATIMAAQTITTTGENVPIPFTLSYDPSQIDERFTYAVRAQITVDGALRWTTTEHTPVLTSANPTTGVEVMVMPVQ